MGISLGGNEGGAILGRFALRGEWDLYRKAHCALDGVFTLLQKLAHRALHRALGQKLCSAEAEHNFKVSVPWCWNAFSAE